MQVSNIIVLGGESRVPTFVARSAERVSGGIYRRVAGQDRYETSVLMAKHLGGWFPTGRATEYRLATVCLVPSGSYDNEAAGSTEGIPAGPWCGRASDALKLRGGPTRGLLPVTGLNPRSSRSDSSPGHSTVPILLMKAGSPRLPGSVAEFLRNSFEPSDLWCSSVTSFSSCTDPGFVVAFGTSENLPTSVLSEAASLVSGGVESPYGFSEPQLNEPFLTALDMSPIFHQAGDGEMGFCLERGGYPSTRWLSTGFQSSEAVADSIDLMAESWYLNDADGQRRYGQVGSPGCLQFESRMDSDPWIKGVGISGHTSRRTGAATQLKDRISMTDNVAAQQIAEASGDDTSQLHTKSGEMVAIFLSTRPQTGLIVDGFVSLIDSAGLTLQLLSNFQSTRMYPSTFNATWTLDTSRGVLYGEASGEAIYDNGYWRMRGRSRAAVGPLNDFESDGGFSADLFVGSAGFGDDKVTWELDAVPSYKVQ